MSMLDQELANGPSGRANGLIAKAAHAAEVAWERVGTAAAVMFPSHERTLGEETRSAMNRLLAGLIAAVEDDLRQRLIEAFGRNAPTALVETLAATDVSIAAPILRHARLLNDETLIAILIRRVEEQRLVGALHRASPPRDTLLDSFLESADEPLAAAAMALIIAESRRAQGVGSLLLARTDLPGDLQHRLLWSVAAALRHYILARAALRASAADRALITATNAALAGYDEGGTLEARAMHLARRLHHRKGLNDGVIRQAFEEGRLVLAVALLAARASIDFDAAWDMVADRGGSRLLVLLRALGVGRQDSAVIAGILAAAEEPSALNEIDARMTAFDLLDPADAAEAVRPWQFDAGYRQALTALSEGLAGGAR